jgi:M6 family metalloprotease-like protein
MNKQRIFTLFFLGLLLIGCVQTTNTLSVEENEMSFVLEYPAVIKNDLEILQPIVVLKSDPAPIEICRIPNIYKTDTIDLNLTNIGFPRPSHTIAKSQIVNIGVVYLDFADYRWSREETAYELTSFLIEPITSYYDTMSQSTIQFNWVVIEDILSMKDNANSYNITRGFHDERYDIKREIVPMLDNIFDIYDFDIFLFGINPDVPESIADVSWMSMISFDDKNHYVALISNDTRRNGYVNIAHEIGHMLGLPDLYKNVCAKNSDCRDGTNDWLWQFQYTGSWSLMSRADHPNNELLAWERWLLEWIDDDDVECINKEQEYVIEIISSFSQDRGTKMVSINLGEHRNLVIEMKEQRPYCLTCEQGLLVYTVNSAVNEDTDYIRIVRPTHSFQVSFEDALLLPIYGYNTVMYEGWHIEIIDNNERGLIVRINKE